MKDRDSRAFASLFRDAYRKCFGSELSIALNEAESIHLSVAIEESTGLEIGWKSLKNYSQHVLGGSSGKSENPSTPTLDTLARYVAGAPPTSKEERHRRERHYPYWFSYKEQSTVPHPPTPPAPHTAARPRSLVGKVAAGLAIAVIAVVVLLAFVVPAGRTTVTFLDEFDDVSDSALAARGWRVVGLDSAHWAERGARSGYLTLFTLKGDNWPDSGATPAVKNLLVREAPSACFVAEVRFTGFFPKQNWQQAGLLLLEDTAFAGRSLRLSIGYNDFAGSFPETEEIRVQAITSLGGSFANPEEVAQRRLFALNTDPDSLVAANLEHVALRIEKRGDRYRLLFSNGPMKNAAFKEAASVEFPMPAGYIAVFAFKGFVEQAGDMPVQLDRFSVTGRECGD